MLHHNVGSEMPQTQRQAQPPGCHHGTHVPGCLTAPDVLIAHRHTPGVLMHARVADIYGVNCSGRCSVV